MPDKRLRAGIALLAMAGRARRPATVAPAQEAPTPRPSLNLYGVTGLIDMPSAEAQPDGQISASYSQFGNTARRNFSFQILPRLSGTLRYSTIKRLGPARRGRRLDPSYNLFDRSFDLQFQLLKERGAGSRRWRSGFRDFLGTGVYSGEYLVATKTVAEDFTLTAGIGWGRLAGVGGFENPFCAISDSFCTRDDDFGEGGSVDFGTFFHGEDTALFGGVEWRTPIDEADAEGRVSPPTPTPASRSRLGLRAQVAGELRRRVPLPRGRHARRLLHVRRHGRLQRRVSRQPEQAADAAEPRRRAAAGQPAAGGRAAGHRLGQQRRRARQADRRRSPRRSTTRASGSRRCSSPRPRSRSRDHQPALQPATPKAIGRTARVLADRHALLGRDLPHHPDRGRAADHDGRRSSARDFEGQVARPNAGEKSWETVGLEGAVAVAGRRRLAARRLSALDWAFVPAPYLYLLTPGDTIRFGRSSTLSSADAALQPGPVGHGQHQPAGDQRARRSRARRTSDAAAGAQRHAALLRRLAPEADAADRRLPLQAQPGHLRPRLGRLHRAHVRRRRRRDPVEAGRPELGARRRPQLCLAARLRQPRLRLLRLRRGDRPRLALLGHRLVRARGAARRRPLPRRRLGRHDHRAPGSSPTAGRSAPTPPRPTSAPRTSARAASTRA